MKSILEEANDIVNNRSEEADRNYGPFSEGMDRAAMIFQGMTGHEVTGADMFKALVALKFFAASATELYKCGDKSFCNKKSSGAFSNALISGFKSKPICIFFIPELFVIIFTLQ